jgi:two-component system chemotaxis sensor kinase CheA
MDMSKYREMFLTEAGEHLRSMSRLVIDLEKNPSDREGIDALFRAAHSIKGMAASMGYERTAQLAHHLEDLMDGLRKSGTVPAAAVDRLLAGADLLEGLLEDLAAERPEREVAAFLAEAPQEVAAAPSPAPEAIAPQPAPAEPGQALGIRVELAADAVAPAARALLILRELARLGEVRSSSPAEAELLRGGAVRGLEIWLQTDREPAEIAQAVAGMTDVRGVHLAGDRRREEPRTPPRDEGGRTVRVRTELLDRLINLTGEMVTHRYMLQTATAAGRWADVREGLGFLARLVNDLHHHVLQVRMMPLESITGRLPRVVREVSRKSGKQVELSVCGAEIELDRSIVEGLADPLVHMVRNAVDHGIETSGKVRVRAWREQDLVVVEVADDGRGIDPELLRRRAVEKGLLSAAQAERLGDREALLLICTPGFSTAAEVTETSGRGVGMDVVKSAVESLSGTLEIRSRPGAGTCIRLRLPLSVAIIQVLLVECDGHTLGLPITRVLRTLEVARAEVRAAGRQALVRLGEEEVPLLSLRKLLRLPAQPVAGTIPVVITEGRGRKVGLVVDRLIGQREAFIKTLAFPLDRLAGVSGATVLGDGSIVFIIDPQPLLAERSGMPRSGATGDRP